MSKFKVQSSKFEDRNALTQVNTGSFFMRLIA